jgi:predicted CXXCH cytochrome family protein
VEIAVALEGGAALESGTIFLGEKSVEMKPGTLTYRVEGLSPGQHTIAADGMLKDPSGSHRFLMVTGVVLQEGKAAKAALKLSPVADVDAYCSTCHPPPGESTTWGQKSRDVHQAGSCEDCHTPHRATEHTKYAVAAFDDSNDLCLKCHDSGHAGRSAPVEFCYNCHTLTKSEVERGTAYLSAASRTLPSIKGLRNQKVPESLACTYCHSSDLNKKTMRGVLSHFGTQASKHPVGYNFGDSAETGGEYLSAWDSATAGELDCVDCHDVKLLVDPSKENKATSAPYANHIDPSVTEREGNPFMLKEADIAALCLSCHGAGETFSKADAVLTAHGEKDLAEDDGTPLKTTDCLGCHDAHYSNKAKLFNDGHRGDTAVEMGDAARCADLCHQRGDASGGYDTAGHGKAKSASGKTIALPCSSCHAVNARHEGTGAKMLNFREDAAKSRYGTSVTSICTTCHRGHLPHGKVKGKVVGCLDCHDEHGEGVGGNASMIASQVPPGSEGGEKTLFERAGSKGYDFYRADGAGLCDNAFCHEGVKSATGTAAAPLAGLMKGGRHSGGDQAPGTDCRTCHSHDSPEGSWIGGNANEGKGAKAKGFH